MFISENCQCSFGYGFIENLVSNCQSLQFYFMQGLFTSVPTTLFSFVDERVIVALVVDNDHIDSEQIISLRKKLRKKHDIHQSNSTVSTVYHLNSTIDSYLSIYADGDDDELETDDDDVGIVEQELVEEEEIVTEKTTRSVDEQVLKRVRNK
jgi:hypothetical protein